MKVRDLMAKLEELSPKHYAMPWDNVGLLLGDENREVKKVLVSVDVHKDIVNKAIEEKVDIIISHHPMIFSGLKQINTLDFLGNKIIKLIKNNISVYAMHTNFDISGSMAIEAAKKLFLSEVEVLEVTAEDGKGLGAIGEISPINLKKFAYIVKDSFSIDMLKIYGNLHSLVSKVAILPGSGRSQIKVAINKGADVMITGDISHHTGLDAIEEGISLIDAGHYGVEKLFIDYIGNYIKDNFSDVEVIFEDKQEQFTWV